MPITFALDASLSPADVAALLKQSGFKRPMDDTARVQRMLDNGTVTVSAHDEGELIGFCRGIGDGAYYCLVAEVAVAPGYKGQGIGKEMLRKVREAAGDEVNLVLNASEEGDPFYEHLGWLRMERGFRDPRKR